jgi:hypothetical protein
VRVQEDRNGTEFLYVSGRTIGKGKDGITAFIRHSKFGDGLSLGITRWGGGGQQNPIVNIDVPKGCVKRVDDEIRITIPIVPNGEWNDGVFDDFVSAKSSRDEDEDRPRRRDRDEDEGEDKPRRRRDDDDEDEERPRKRKDDDEDEEPPRRKHRRDED